MPYDAKKVAGTRIEGISFKEPIGVPVPIHYANLILFRDIDSKFATTTNGAIVKKSNGELLPDDEPLFLFRARDNKALKILLYYRELCAMDAGSDWQVEKMSNAIEEFVKFKNEHPERMKQPGITKGA